MNFKKEAYRDCIKRKGDKIGITYVHIGSVLSQRHIPILSPDVPATI